MRLLRPVLAFALLLSACSSSASDGDAPPPGGAADAGDPGDDAGEPRTFGGARPVTVRVPAGYDPSRPAPLVVLLHGYGASGQTQDLVVTHLAEVADGAGFFLTAPNGTVDSRGSRFWNATDACCDFDDQPVDDVAYLGGLVEEIQAAYAIDPKRIFFVGHSNGGFMSHRMACERADLVAGIVSLAGAVWEDASKCAPSEPVAVLEVHGDEDADVKYEGDPGGVGPGNAGYPSAPVTVATWAQKNGCEAAPSTQAGAKDLVASLAGDETDVTSYGGCTKNGAAELWTIHGAGHIPDFGTGFGKAIWEGFLKAHAKP